MAFQCLGEAQPKQSAWKHWGYFSLPPQVPLSVDEPPDAQNIDYHPVFDHAEGGAGIVDGDDVQPSDSVSNAPSKMSKGSSKGSKSTVSSTVSARIKAEADMAALIAHQKWLKDKHALKEQELAQEKKRAAWSGDGNCCISG